MALALRQDPEITALMAVRPRIVVSGASAPQAAAAAPTGDAATSRGEPIAGANWRDRSSPTRGSWLGSRRLGARPAAAGCSDV